MYPSAVIIIVALDRTRLGRDPEIHLQTVIVTIPDAECSEDSSTSSLTSRDTGRDTPERSYTDKGNRVDHGEEGALPR